MIEKIIDCVLLVMLALVAFYAVLFHVMMWVMVIIPEWRAKQKRRQ